MDTPWYLQYYPIYLLKKQAFALMVFFMDSRKQTLVQIFLNIHLSFIVLAYLIVFKPFLEGKQQKITVYNEICYYVISCLFMGYTNFNSHFESKITNSWIIVIFAISNLIFPNGYELLVETFGGEQGCFKSV